MAAGAYVKSVQRSQVRPVFAHRSGHLFGLHEGSAAGSILHVARTRAGIPWFDMTWKLNEFERPEWSRELPRLELGESHLPSHAASNPTALWREGVVAGLE